MSRIEGPVYTGSLTSDLTDVKDFLVDLPPGGLKGARGEQEGLGAVLAELAHSMPTYGDDAEIHPAVYQRVVTSTNQIEQLAQKELVLLKQLEVVRESKGRLINNREDDLSNIGARAAESATRRKKPELGAHFERTIKYRSQIAEKGAETRKKNESTNKPEAEPTG